MGNDIAQGCDPPEDLCLRIQINDLRLSWALHLLPRGMIGHRAMTSLTTRRRLSQRTIPGTGQPLSNFM